MARFEKGHPKLPGAGRKKGQVNKTTATMTALLDNEIASDPEGIARDFQALRTSDDPSDRRTYWTAMLKRVANKVEGDVKMTLEDLIGLSMKRDGL